jgi:hypothetical protein
MACKVIKRYEHALQLYAHKEAFPDSLLKLQGNTEDST